MMKGKEERQMRSKRPPEREGEKRERLKHEEEKEKKWKRKRSEDRWMYVVTEWGGERGRLAGMVRANVCVTEAIPRFTNVHTHAHANTNTHTQTQTQSHTQNKLWLFP